MIVIPKAKAQMDVPFEQIIADQSKNVRMPELYDVESLMRDVEQNGLKMPLSVHKTGNKVYEVMAGFRRHLAVSKLREKNPNLFQMVPCSIYEGLTEAQVTAITCDHGNVESLNDYELYTSALRLFATGATEEEVGAAHGKSRSWAQERKMLAQLPSFVREEFRKKFLGQSKGLTTKDIRSLYTIQAQTGNDSANPSPQLMDAWGKMTSTQRPQEPKAKTRKELLTLANMFTASKKVNAVLRFAAGEPGINIADYNTPDA